MFVIPSVNLIISISLGVSRHFDCILYTSSNAVSSEEQLSYDKSMCRSSGV